MCSSRLSLKGVIGGYDCIVLCKTSESLPVLVGRWYVYEVEWSGNAVFSNML